MKAKRHLAAVLLLVVLGPQWLRAAECFITTTFGNDARCEHKGALEVKGELVRFDLSALPGGTPGTGGKVLRAILRVPVKGHNTGVAVRVVPAGLAGAAAMKLRPPDYTSFDATAASGAWAADPEANKGFTIVQSGGVDFRSAVLEVSYRGRAAEPIPPVTRLAALHQSGQTFLTWKEIEDPVGQDSPTFGDFDKAVLDARAKRRLVYRVYRHTEPITPANLDRAELAREVPEAISCWNLQAVRNTEHPNQGTGTKHSELRPGYNLALNHVMTRYRITSKGEPLPRATGLAVFTITKPARHYYAVVASIDGREAVAKLGDGASLAQPVDEKPSQFPAIVYQRTSEPGPKHTGAPEVDVYNSWLEPPYVNIPSPAETFIVRWPDLPKGGADGPTTKITKATKTTKNSSDLRDLSGLRDRDLAAPLMVTTGTHGCSATELSDPGWHGARRHVRGALTLGLAEGGLWQGFHECIGTLRGYDDGVVHNYPQRRVLAATAWALSRPELSLDPRRVSIWGQMAHWALRHGDVYAVVMSNGYGNLAIGKEAQKHGWKWGPYPAGSKNSSGVDQWEYMDLPKWIRENPTVELPYWLCWPAYGAYPSHTIGDFGFMPWPEMIHAMASTKRAFAANWSTNGPGPVGPLRELVPRIRLDQPLPAFTNCSLDHSPGDGDHADAQKDGGINLYQLWEPETILDEPGRWEITVFLRDDCPYPTCTTGLTPRRCRRFLAKRGDEFRWACKSLDGKQELQSGTARADEWGLVTIEKLVIRKTKSRVSIAR